MRDHLAASAGIHVSHETIRQILRRAGISFQNTETWNHSNDPDFAVKKDGALALYDDRPTDGRVICVDEFRPLNLMPRPGKGWFPVGRPRRLRATYHRTAGVRHMFAALDLAGTRARNPELPHMHSGVCGGSGPRHQPWSGLRRPRDSSMERIDSGGGMVRIAKERIMGLIHTRMYLQIGGHVLTQS